MARARYSFSHLSGDHFLFNASSGCLHLQDFADQLTIRPDHLSTTEYEKLKAMIDPVMVEASLHAESDELSLRLSLPLLSKEDKEKVKAILASAQLKWSNGKFVGR